MRARSVLESLVEALRGTLAPMYQCVEAVALVDFLCGVASFVTLNHGLGTAGGEGRGATTRRLT